VSGAVTAGVEAVLAPAADALWEAGLTTCPPISRTNARTCRRIVSPTWVFALGGGKPCSRLRISISRFDSIEARADHSLLRSQNSQTLAMFITLFYWWLALTAVVLVIAIALAGLGVFGKLLRKSDRQIFLSRKLSSKFKFLLLIVTILALTLVLLVAAGIVRP
jgi:hypothetical protein